MLKVNLYTDGGCRGNPGPGAWAFILEFSGNFLLESGFQEDTTNNRMEMTAIMEGLKRLKGHCEVSIVSDSQYSLKGISEWLEGWKQKGFKQKGSKDIKNKDLWIELDQLVSQHKIHCQWVRGHQGHPQNELCDYILNKEMDLSHNFKLRFKGSFEELEKKLKRKK